MLYIKVDVPNLLTFVTVGLISPVIVPAAKDNDTPVPVKAMVPAVVVVTPALAIVIPVALVVPTLKTPAAPIAPATNVSSFEVLHLSTYKPAYVRAVDPNLLTIVTVGLISPVIVPAKVMHTPTPVKATVPAVVVFTPTFPNVISVAFISPISKVPAAPTAPTTIVSSFETLHLSTYNPSYIRAVDPNLLIIVTVGLMSPVIVPATFKLTPTPVNSIIPAFVVVIPVLPNVIAVVCVSPTLKISAAPTVPATIVSRFKVLHDSTYNSAYVKAADPNLLTIVVVGLISPVIVPAIVKLTPVPASAKIPAVDVLTPNFPKVIPVALVSPRLKIPAAPTAPTFVSSCGVLRVSIYALLYNNAGAPKLLTFVTVGLISPVIVPAITISTPTFVIVKPPSIVVVIPDRAKFIPVAFVSPILKTPATPEPPATNASSCWVRMPSIYDSAYNNVELPKLSTFVTDGFISPVIVPANVIFTAVEFSANIPAVVVVTPAFPNVIAVAFISPIAKTPEAIEANASSFAV